MAVHQLPDPNTSRRALLGQPRRADRREGQPGEPAQPDHFLPRRRHPRKQLIHRTSPDRAGSSRAGVGGGSSLRSGGSSLRSGGSGLAVVGVVVGGGSCVVRSGDADGGVEVDGGGDLAQQQLHVGVSAGLDEAVGLSRGEQLSGQDVDGFPRQAGVLDRIEPFPPVQPGGLHRPRQSAPGLLVRDPGREDRFIDAGQDRGRGPLQRTRGLQPPAGLLGAGDQLGHHRSRGRHRRIVEFPTDHPGPEPIQPASGHLRDQVRGARQQRQCLPETVTSGLHRDPQTRRHQLRSIHRLIPDPVVDLLEGAVLTLGDFDRRELAQRLDLAGVDHIAQLLQPRQTGRQPRQTPLPPRTGQDGIRLLQAGPDGGEFHGHIVSNTRSDGKGLHTCVSNQFDCPATLLLLPRATDSGLDQRLRSDVAPRSLGTWEST